MGGFSRSSPPSAVQPCSNACIDAKAKDEVLIHGARERAAVIGKRPPSPSLCQQEAKKIPAIADRMDRYEKALPSARAARDMNELGAKDGSAVNQPCITRLPLDAKGVNKALGIDPNSPNAIKEADLRNEKIGYRSALYRDDTNGKLILVSRDTDPHSLVDWKTNIENGQAMDTDQYSAVRGLSAKLAKNGQSFDIAGYSKGGGLAQEAGLMSPNSQVYVFNSAGLDSASLARTGQSSFSSLASRTHAFSAQGDFLTYMNNTTNPAQKIVNAQFLHDQLAGTSGGLSGLVKPMQIQNPTSVTTGGTDPAFLKDRGAFLQQLQGLIRGGKVNFPPVRAVTNEAIPNSVSTTNRILGANSDQPTIGKLAQHKLENVVGTAGNPGPMEKQIAADRAALKAFRGHCG
jgi:hypothetical protein